MVSAQMLTFTIPLFCVSLLFLSLGAHHSCSANRLGNPMVTPPRAEQVMMVTEGSDA